MFRDEHDSRTLLAQNVQIRNYDFDPIIFERTTHLSSWARLFCLEKSQKDLEKTQKTKRGEFVEPLLKRPDLQAEFSVSFPNMRDPAN